MERIPNKIKQWIEEKKDPRSAHWQGGLEEILNVFSPHMEPGKLIPVQPLEEEDLPVFMAALEAVDLSPNLHAAFLPPSIAGSVTPPESADELQRIPKGNPSYKILIKDAVSSIQNIKNKDDRVAQSNKLAEREILELLSLMRELEIVNFGEFSNTENERFKKEFSRTIRKIKMEWGQPLSGC